MEQQPTDSRRDILRKAVFVTPLILTLPVFPSFAQTGSHGADDHDDGAHGSAGHPDRRRRRRRHDFWSMFGF
jgi:hypothetical protein